MNNQLIEKVIKSNDANACPVFTYENPLLDRNVAKALSRSFVKILKVSQQNTNINNNLRNSILANIRKTCRAQPENHLDIGETATNLLTEVYLEVKDPHTKPCPSLVAKKLDDFLTRKLKGLDINQNYQSPLNPEVAQSLINLNERSIEPISQNILNIDIGNKKSLTLIKDLWTKPDCKGIVKNICDISICMKSEIEKILLELCHTLLTDPSVNFNEFFCLDNLKDLVHKCSKSPECFQICYEILNCLFSTVNYNSKIQLFVSEFVKRVKEIVPSTISVLYPAHLCHIVLLLNIDMDTMPTNIQNGYIQKTLPHLKRLHSESMSELILLLSHYPDWFDIYFKQ